MVQALTPLQLLDQNKNIANNSGNIPTLTPTKPPTTPPTTISNMGAMDKVNGIVTKNQNLSDSTGLTTDTNGNQVYSNGTVYTPPGEGVNGTTGYVSGYDNGKAIVTPYGQTPTNPNQTPNTYTDYFGNTQTVPADGSLPAGSVPDGKGNYIGLDGKQYGAPANDTSYNIKYQQDNLAQLKTQVDSNTADLIDSIQKQYATLIENQKQINASQTGKVQNALLTGGVTGQGSISQYASTSADSQVTQVMQYGVQQIADLQSKEDTAISNAKIAGENQDYQIMDKQNALAETIRVEKQTAAQKLLEQVNDAKSQNQIDSAVTNLYSQGTTNPSDILASLTKGGFTANGIPVTLKDIQTSLENKIPQGVNDLVSTIEKNGAPADLIAKVMASPDLTTAIKNAGNYVQSASGTLGDYLEYQRQGGVQNYDQWTKAQEDYKNQEAIKLKQAEAAITASNSGLSPSDITSLVNTLSDYQGKKYVTSTDLTGYDTKQKAALITALKSAGIVTLSPKDSDAINTIQTAQSDLQNFSGAINGANLPKNFMGQPLQYANVTLNRLLQINPNLASYKTNLLAVLPTLSALKGVGSGGGGASRLFATISDLFPQDTDTLDVAQTKLNTIYSMLDNGATGIVGQTPVSTQKNQDAQDITSIQTFHDASPENAKQIDDLHIKFPNASPSQIKQALGL